MRYFIHAAICAGLVLTAGLPFTACNDDGGIVHRGDLPNGEQEGSVNSVIHYGDIHNAALEAVRTAYTPSDFPSFSSSSATTAYNKLDLATAPVIVQGGIDTTGLSAVRPAIVSWFTGWWPDSVTRKFPTYFSTLNYYNNPSAVARIVNFLDDTDPSGLTKLQYRNQLNAVCDSLLAALATQTAVTSEIALVQVTKSSLDFWYNFSDVSWNGSTPNAIALAAVVQIDCGGFLVGWALTAGAQIATEGKFTATIGGQMTPQEKQRIAGGLVGAANASGGGMPKMANTVVRWISGLWK
ncbi:MAG: hypothetical protein FGM24_09615 [Candidatus Kapabacteria bacterium]|nr:hypothetical protein [Candidatus Kapabacteria bacterium]